MSESQSLADWLALREPFDAASRSAALTAAVAAALPRGRPLRVLDLGCGTGSNTRYLLPHIAAIARPGASGFSRTSGPPQGGHDIGRETEWLLVDKDPAVLALAREALQSASVETRQLDLGEIGRASERMEWTSWVNG